MFLGGRAMYCDFPPMLPCFARTGCHLPLHLLIFHLSIFFVILHFFLKKEHFPNSKSFHFLLQLLIANMFKMHFFPPSEWHL